MAASDESLTAYDEFLAALDGTGYGPRDVISITGFRLIDSPTTGYRRLYLDEGELSWIDVLADAILHSRVYAQDSNPLGLTTIWIPRDTAVEISQEVGAEDVAMGFLAPARRGGDTAPGWCRDSEGFVTPCRTTRPSGRGSCFGAYSGRGPC